MSNHRSDKVQLPVKPDPESGDSRQEVQSDLLAEADNAISETSQTLEEVDDLRGVKIGDGRVFAGPDASPPFPEGIVANRNRIYVAGPAAFGDNGGSPRRFESSTGSRASSSRPSSSRERFCLRFTALLG